MKCFISREQICTKDTASESTRSCHGGYTRENLLSLNHQRPPTRTVRQAVYYHRLRHRRRSCAVFTTVTTQAHPTSHPGQRSPHVTVGWLNIQCINKKSIAAAEMITDHSLDVFAIT